MTDRHPEPHCAVCQERVHGGIRTDTGAYKLTPCGHVAEVVWR